MQQGFALGCTSFLCHDQFDYIKMKYQGFLASLSSDLKSLEQYKDSLSIVK